ncbi:formyl transferase [Tumebacillus sp. ITR2]|uniref:Formyl transferase n=1 Tax=Tumebacillus amylolyticus TaxID=2801339 RepID=A0ABS1J5I5_9BACL|nr:formyltransferase family protein [Tumebacillus amylolyticus]MBL0385527.1 formyl transferase [Tumebacillus amylolyticus]
MKILLLGPERPEFVAYLRAKGDDVHVTEAPLHGTSELLEGVDFLISYGYRHILRADVLDRFPKRAINLHISLLPWNRGADPNLWSFLEDSPKGVTIHELDPGIDTGGILAQQEVGYEHDDTLASSYARLTSAIQELFFREWPGIRNGETQARLQVQGGSFHLVKHKQPYEHLLTAGWNTPVRDLIGKALTNPQGV